MAVFGLHFLDQVGVFCFGHGRGDAFVDDFLPGVVFGFSLFCVSQSVNYWRDEKFE